MRAAAPSEVDEHTSGSRRIPLSVVVLVAALALGIVLRLIFPADIEYKGDERWTFEQVQAVLSGGAWPSVGMPMSVGGANPGLSVWIFVVLGALWGADTAPHLTTAVHVLNILAIFGFVAFIRFTIAAAEREPWYWAAALWSVNPVAIMIERKLWPPSVTAPFVVAMLACWWHRERALPAFGWGLLGALIGQLHVGAWFFTLVLLVWTLIHDRRLTQWRAWLIGNVIGGLFVLPWLVHSLTHRGDSNIALGYAPKFHAFIRWFTQPFGFGAEYSIGNAEMWSFLKGPHIAGHASYLMGAVHILLIVLTVAAFAAALERLRQIERPSPRDMFIGRDNADLLLRASFWGYCGLLTAVSMAGVDSHRHYLAVVIPVMALWAARLVLQGDWSRAGNSPRAILTAFCILQGTVSAGLIGYIHLTQVIAYPYGPTWGAQQGK